MSKEYLLGLLSAKVSKLLTDSDYEVLKSLKKQEFIEYLYNSNIFISKTHDFEYLVKEYQINLAEEISSYIGSEHPIYKYFFEETNNLTKHYNNLYDNIKVYVPYISKYHHIKNFLMMIRLINKDKDLIYLEKYLLKQDEVSKEMLLNIYKNGKDEIYKTIKEFFDLNISKNALITEVGKMFDEYIYETISELAYGSLEGLMFFYVYRKNLEIENIKSIYYMGDLS